jgi:prepilin peptidase CpaA
MAKWAKKNLPRYATGSLAAALSLYFVYEGRADLTILAASIFFLLICIVDTVYSRIPNLASLLFLLTGLGHHLYSAGASGLLFSVLGILTGFSLLFLPYLMGGMGAGDVKALAALGALLGPGAIFQVFLYTGLIGGLLALFHYALSHNLKEKCLEWIQAIKAFAYTRSFNSLKPAGRAEQLRFPYAAAIAFGFFAWVNWGGLL